MPASFEDACRRLLGDEGLLTDAGDIAAYTVDFWRQNEGRTELVLRPRTVEQVAAVVALANEHGVAIVPQGGNTGLVAGGIPDGTGSQVVLSLARLDRVRGVDPADDHIVVEAGCTLSQVQEAAAAAGRLFPLTLGSMGSCRIGGNLSTNAGGVNVLRYGMARDLVLGLEVVLADGRIWNGLRTLRKDNTGYDLKQVFLGAEGTLGIITAAGLRLFALPRERVTLFMAVPDPEAAVTLLARAKDRFGELVTSFELLHGGCVDAAVENLDGIRRPLDTHAPWYVLMELGWSLSEGLAEAAESWLEAVYDAGIVQDAMRAESEAQRAMLWRMREELSGAMRKMGKIARNDISVPIARIPELCARGAALVERLVPEGRLLPFGHVGDGNLHFNILVPMDTPDIAALSKRIQASVFDLVAELGGSISAEHGIGRSKREELAKHKTPLELELMGRLKAALDPKGILNPGVILREPA
ncbi:MAG: FAD-binding oxidoreductase [Geminicoccaceae bacterium]